MDRRHTGTVEACHTRNEGADRALVGTCSAVDTEHTHTSVPRQSLPHSTSKQVYECQACLYLKTTTNLKQNKSWSNLFKTVLILIEIN